MATVNVEMPICGKTNKITVSKRPDGDFDVSMESDCDNAIEYVNKLKLLTEMDILDYTNSKINDPEVRGNLFATCLIPTAIFTAGWLENGMISKSLVEKSKNNRVEFIDSDGKIL